MTGGMGASSGNTVLILPPFPVGILNDNRKIDYRKSKRILVLVLVSLLLILKMGTCALAAVSEERLLALLICLRC